MRWFALILALSLALMALAAPSEVSLWLPARFTAPKGQIVLVARLRPHDGNRALFVSVDGPSYYRSTLYDLTAHAALSYRVQWAIGGPGEYAATAELVRMIDGRERRYRTAVPFTVIGAVD